MICSSLAFSVQPFSAVALRSRDRRLLNLQDMAHMATSILFRRWKFKWTEDQANFFVRFSFVFRNFCVRRGEGRRHGGAARPARPLGPGRALAATNAKIEKGGQKMDRGENLGTLRKSRDASKTARAAPKNVHLLGATIS